MKSRATSSGLLVTAVVFLLVVVGGAGWFLVRSRSIAKGSVNVVLISLDTCRADRLSCYGFPRTTTPNIDALARDGVLFGSAISPVPMTLPAHCSLLTGTNPPYHGVHGNISYRLDASNVTLAEKLAEHGYTTGAVLASYVLDEKFQMNQGFQFYDADFGAHTTGSEILNERSGDEVNRVATAWLEEHADERFFLFLHYYDPHFPYDPPEEFASKFENHPYLGEIAFVDHCVGGIVAALKRLDLYESTMIVITADHGESLEEHGESTHGYFVYHATTRVPLIIKLPGRRDGRRVTEKVALVDVFPTVLEYVGIDVPPDVHGTSLVPHFSRGSARSESNYIYSESLMATGFGCSSLLALENEEWKYIQSSKPELYNLRQDPNELTNLIDQEPLVARDMKERLRSRLAEETRIDGAGAVLAMDADAIKRLEGLGYVEGSTPQTLEFETDKESPVDFLPFFLNITRASELLLRDPDTPLRETTADGGTRLVSKRETAKRLCMEILAERSDNQKAHSILGRLAFEEGDFDAAGEHYSALVRIDPQSPAAAHDLGNIRARQGRSEEAESLYRRAIALADAGEDAEPGLDGLFRRGATQVSAGFEARLRLADMFFKQDRLDDAADIYREVLRIKPRHAKAMYVIGRALSAQGRSAEAIESYRSALEVKPEYDAARRALDELLEQAPNPSRP